MQANAYEHKETISFVLFYSERERQKIVRRGQARRRNRRLCGQMCAHFKEVRKQT